MRLTPDLLISAYAQGVFPMPDEYGRIHFYDPDPRAIIPLDSFHLSKRLARTIRSQRFEVRFDSDWQGVIEGCAETYPGRESTWINPEMQAAYTRLFQLGIVHTVECWREERLVGGLYGVALRGLFAGESMFSRERDASKVALAHLVDHLRQQGFVLLDSQYIVGTHMLQFGTIEIPRDEYHERLAHALTIPAHF